LNIEDSLQRITVAVW